MYFQLFRIFFVVITYLMVIAIPQLPVMCSLVGVTSGTLCALIYPPIFELIAFWDDWKVNLLMSREWDSFRRVRKIEFVFCSHYIFKSGIIKSKKINSTKFNERIIFSFVNSLTPFNIDDFREI